MYLLKFCLSEFLNSIKLNGSILNCLDLEERNQVLIIFQANMVGFPNTILQNIG